MAQKTRKKMFLGSCPICRKRLKEHGVRVIDKDDDVALCCVQCSFCRSSFLFTVSSKREQETITAVGVLADIQEEDVNMVKKHSTPVNSDDVLAIHLYLESYDKA